MDLLEQLELLGLQDRRVSKSDIFLQINSGRASKITPVPVPAKQPSLLPTHDSVIQAHFAPALLLRPPELKYCRPESVWFNEILLVFIQICEDNRLTAKLFYKLLELKFNLFAIKSRINLINEFYKSNLEEMDFNIKFTDEDCEIRQLKDQQNLAAHIEEQYALVERKQRRAQMNFIASSLFPTTADVQAALQVWEKNGKIVNSKTDARGDVFELIAQTIITLGDYGKEKHLLYLQFLLSNGNKTYRRLIVNKMLSQMKKKDNPTRIYMFNILERTEETFRIQLQNLYWWY